MQLMAASRALYPMEHEQLFKVNVVVCCLLSLLFVVVVCLLLFVCLFVCLCVSCDCHSLFSSLLFSSSLLF